MSSVEPQGCLAAILRLFGIRLGPSRSTTCPYRQRDDFLTAAELSFYRVLVPVVGGSYVICMKVRLADIVCVTVNEGWQSHQNRINRKHIDFLLCDPETMHPQLGIELDDASHSRKDRQDRDEFVDQVFEASALPLLHIRVAARYVPSELSDKIEKSLAKRNTPTNPNSLRLRTDAEPFCPKCQILMVVRKVKKGDRHGQNFWGCPNFPDCRQTIDI